MHSLELNETLAWAQEIAPGFAIRWPPPTMLATEAEWCGSLNGGLVINSSARLKPASECTAETSSASRTSRSGSSPGTRSASIVLPTPGGP
jgi:hypothetical protein